MNIERQIKQKIYAKKHEFFLIIPLGLEKIASEELKTFNIEHKVEKGGITVEEKIDKLYELNLRTRVATRILMRIANFKSLYASNLKNGIAAIEWLLFLKENSNFTIIVKSRKSKLYHSGLIEETVVKEILKYSEKNSLNYKFDKDGHKIYIRVENDRATVSIDSSGEMLYKRGYKKYSSIAPLRENIAAAILLKYWDKDIKLLDPMTGSGTFSLEANLIKNSIAPGLNREFAFMDWNNFKEKSFNFIKKNILNESLNEKTNIEASDINSELIEKTKLNFNSFETLEKPQVKDFFDIIPEIDKGFLILNLPYGLRIEKNKKFYSQIAKKLRKDFKGWQSVILYPRDISFPLDGEIMKFSNGGFPINLLFSTIK